MRLFVTYWFFSHAAAVVLRIITLAGEDRSYVHHAAVVPENEHGDLAGIRVANLDEASRAVQRFRDGPADFADYFLAEINTSAGCAATATFDRDALKSGEPFAAVPTRA